jgi:hypothetical protein
MNRLADNRVNLLSLTLQAQLGHYDAAYGASGKYSETGYIDRRNPGLRGRAHPASGTECALPFCLKVWEANPGYIHQEARV